MTEHHPWKVHTPLLLQEIGINQSMSALKIPLNIFASILGEVAARAIELNDPALNRLMLRLALYEEGDPSSPHYNPKLLAEPKPMTSPKPIRYEVTNRRTGNVTSYKTGAAASKAMDRIDNAYGSYTTTRRAIWED